MSTLKFSTGRLHLVCEGLKFTRVSIIQDHPAVAGLRPRPAHRLQAESNPCAGLQVEQGEREAVLPVPEGHLLLDVVCPVEVEHGQEEERVLLVLRAVPGQRYAAAVP